MGGIWNSTLPRRAPLQRSPWPRPALSVVVPLRRTPIKQVSAKRQRENRQRRAMADQRWPDRREGTVMCAVPWCGQRADDLHEILPRGRSGSITDPDNTVPVCRGHNEELTRSPAWAYRAGLLKHDGICCRGRQACSRYGTEPPEGAA